MFAVEVLFWRLIVAILAILCIVKDLIMISGYALIVDSASVFRLQCQLLSESDRQ